MNPVALSISHSDSVDIIIGFYLTDGRKRVKRSEGESPDDILAMKKDPGTLVPKGSWNRALGVNSRKSECSGSYRTSTQLSL